MGEGAVVESKGQEAAITVAATAPGELSNLFIVWGLAGAGGKSKADVAGSIGVQVIEYRTTASVGAGATLDSAGALTVEASNPMALQDLVLAGGPDRRQRRRRRDRGQRDRARRHEGLHRIRNGARLGHDSESAGALTVSAEAR